MELVEADERAKATRPDPTTVARLEPVECGPEATPNFGCLVASASVIVMHVPPLSWWSKFLVVAVLVNAMVYLAQAYFAWPSIVRASIGIGIAVLGLFFLGGGAGGSYLLEQADARAVRHDDVERYVSDRTRSLGLGARMILLGVTIFLVALVLP